jgi:hypothetical protein
MHIMRGRLTLLWLLLVGLSLSSWWIGARYNGRDAAYSKAIAILALSIAFLKARLVIFEYMGARGGSRRVRTWADAWIVSTWAMLVGLGWLHV